MNKIKKSDTVYVLAGKDKGKSGRVFKVYPREGRALVEGINYIKKHARKSQDNPHGGIVQKESPIHISNLALLCKTCNRPARLGMSSLADGTKSRFCKRCKEVI
ncbi:MAG: 50S ribosomal protein L24 [Omnitrophica bacterium RIFCSPLOWO2_02_FULL_45_16]|nr:MAG: 50S ribosomal protein L24 [Omnitrophica bacterium RIFCSPHIGHO2_02_FULL_46_20]OGW92558.1 MAG: 50S ribosomal protein L24 [Omnitrophica bacterium RIFCSPLOWO2_12_FULL_45_13]OGW93172.1 MAG: 50S ribosomal protein L24 [Omnitrophica bacterium RIFCSPLOWO2_01_FULL_45_24]OGX00139.1 MAG: 50S ribosomal protein L24 [Omnitrophica bacterium RIFCSPLOWO2_02_FULL_45_16]